jgi:iron complex transport system permease protein
VSRVVDVVAVEDRLREQLRRDRSLRGRRNGVVGLVAGLLVAGLALGGLTMGSVRLSARQVLQSLTGQMDNPSVNFVVRELLGPTVLAGLVTGAALGVAGTMFQQLLRNPLAAPDFVGVSSGASLAAVAGIVVYGWAGISIPVLALAGAFASAALMYLLAWRDGVDGYRFILVGIGVSAFLLGLTSYLLARADISDARQAMRWLTGSVGQSGMTEVWLLAAALLALVPLGPFLRRSLRTLTLGDDSARALGTRAEAARLGLVLVAVVLTALATAVSGPLVFVALVSGPLADRLLGRAAGGLLAAGLVGAALVLVADHIATYLLPIALPTGVVTGAVGAPYLLWLLVTSNREGSMA